MTYQQREEVKLESQRVLNSETASVTEKMNAAENICKAYFSRSLGAVDFNPQHPDFEQYISMLLKQPLFKKRFKSIYHQLVEKYGTRDGIPNGHTYFDCSTNNNKPDDVELEKDIIIYNRNGKVIKKKISKEKMDLLTSMLDAIPEDDNPDL